MILLLNLIGGTRAMENYMLEEMSKLAEPATSVTSTSEKGLHALPGKIQGTNWGVSQVTAIYGIWTRDCIAMPAQQSAVLTWNLNFCEPRKRCRLQRMIPQWSVPCWGPKQILDALMPEEIPMNSQEGLHIPSEEITMGSRRAFFQQS